MITPGRMRSQRSAPHAEEGRHTDRRASGRRQKGHNRRSLQGNQRRRERRGPTVFRRTWNALVQRDLTLLKGFLDVIESHPRIEAFLSRITSPAPYQDVVMFVWLGFVLAVYDLGPHFFWMCSLNLCTAFAANRLIRARRPVEYDIELQPRADRGADSFGLPSIESHMSIVVFGYLAYKVEHPLAWMLACALVLLVGASRLYARSRFVHQVVGSWCTGILGVYVGHHCCELLGFLRMRHFPHACCVAAVLVAALIVVALAIESNDSRLLYVPRNEYVRVLSDILNSTPSEDGPLGSVVGDSGLPTGSGMGPSAQNHHVTGAVGLGSPRSALSAMGARGRPTVSTPRGTRAVRMSEEERRAEESRKRVQAWRDRRYPRTGRYTAHDSFYYLHQTMLQRQKEDTQPDVS